jgi:hypothetical protein
MSFKIGGRIGELPSHLREAIQQFVDRHNEDYPDTPMRPTEVVITCDPVMPQITRAHTDSGPQLERSHYPIGVPQADDPDHGED